MNNEKNVALPNRYCYKATISPKVKQAKPLKCSKIRFKRFLLFGGIFILTIILSGLFGILEGNKRISESVLLGNIAKKYDFAQDRKKKEQALTQKIE